MILLFDAGNTRLKWAVVKSDCNSMEHDNGIFEQGSVDYRIAGNGENEMSKALSEMAAVFEFSEIWASSVAGGQREATLSHLSVSLFGLTPKYVGVTETACGIKNTYRSLKNLGVDRWVAAMGLSASVGVNRVIIDAGTAVTVDLVRADNTFMGGGILPGAQLMHDSLVGETAGIKSARQDVLVAIGRDTQECVNVGAKYGLAGAIDRVVNELVATVNNGKPWQVVVCGGDARWLKDIVNTPLPVFYKPNLIFDGLLNLRQFGESR